MKRLPYCLFITLIVFTYSCKTNQVLVKIKNASNEEFKQLYVNILGKEFYFDSLKSGETTQFIKVKQTYSYCYVKAITSKDTILFLPIDYVGEELFRNGRLLMKISILPINNSRRQLDIISKRILL